MQTTNTAKSQYGYSVIVEIPEALDLAECRRRYQQPLQLALADTGTGTVIGCNSILNALKQPAAVDLELALPDLEDALQLARARLAVLGVPPDSLLLFMRDARPRALPVDPMLPECDSPRMQQALQRRSAPTALRRARRPSHADALRTRARLILEEFERLWDTAPQFEMAQLDAYEPELVDLYRQVSLQLQAFGFHPIGDLVPARRGGEPAARIPASFSRKLLSRDGVIRVSVHHSPPSERKAERSTCIDMVSELDEGTLMATNNQPPKWNTPEGLLLRSLAWDARPAQLVDTHRQRLTQLLEQQPARTALAMRSLQDVLASEERAQRLTAGFRRRQSLPSLEELQRLGAKPSVAQQLLAEMQLLRDGATAPTR